MVTSTVYYSYYSDLHQKWIHENVDVPAVLPGKDIYDWVYAHLILNGICAEDINLLSIDETF